MANNSSTSLDACIADRLPPNTEQLAVGIFYLSLSSFFLIIYFPTLIFVWKDEELMDRPVFKILVWDSLCDLCQVIGLGFIAGIYTLINCIGSRPLNRFIGSFINIPWLAGGIMDVAVAFNRYLSVSSPYWMERLFAGRKAYYWVATGWIYGLCLNGFYLIRDGGVIYDLEKYAWWYSDYPGSTENLITKVEIAQDYITEPLMFFFCVGIMVQLVRKRKDTSNAHLSIKEKYAIYQVFLICSSLMAMNFIYLVVPQFTSSKWAIMAGNTLWVIVCGWFPLIMLKFNLTLRQKILAVIGIGKGPGITHVTPFAHTKNGPSSTTATTKPANALED